MRRLGGYTEAIGASVSLLALWMSNGEAKAQTLPVPAGLPTREDLSPVPERRDEHRSQVSVEDRTERAPCPLADPAYADVKVNIASVAFNNLKRITPEELRPVYTGFLGSDRPIASLCEIRDAVATYLRNKGYLAAVQVPAQKIENGTVRFEVIYARMTTVRVRGEAQGAERIIERYLEPLTHDEVFNRNTAERALLLARDLPGYDLRLTLRPAGTGAGDMIGEVTVYRTPVEIDATIQNLAAKDTGHWGGQLRAQFNGLTGMGDSTSVSLYSTADFKEQQIFQLGHDMRIGGHGLTLSGQFTYAWTKPDLNGAPGTPDLTARTLFASIEAGYPLIRSLGQNLRAAAGFDFVNQGVRFIAPISRDRLRVGYARLDYDAIDTRNQVTPRWRLGATVELRQGFNVFNASPNCAGGCPGGGLAPSRFDGKSDATVLRFNAEGEVAIARQFSAVLRPRAQLASASLLSFEEFSAGNYTVGRGYDPGTIIGDNGLGFQFELRGKRMAPLSMKSLTVQPYVFADAAWVWNRNVAGDPQRLVSVGGGVRAELSRRFRLDMALAVPTEKAGLQAKRSDPRFLLTLTTRLIPWGTR